ncbi:hypothetical protein ACFL0G_03685 [Candidatus Zixiibacteriota bacterium]
MKYLALKTSTLSIVLITILLLSCRSGVQDEVHENPEAAHKILITGTSSDFKAIIIQGLLERYGETCQIEILPSDDLIGIESADYSAIVIMDELRMGRTFTGKPRELARQVDDKRKVILFITAGKEDWQFSAEGIDAITAASEVGRAGEVLEQIAERIDWLVE